MKAAVKQILKLQLFDIFGAIQWEAYTSNFVCIVGRAISFSHLSVHNLQLRTIYFNTEICLE